MINIEKTMSNSYPLISQSYPKPIYKSMVNFLTRILHEKDINAFLETHKGLNALAFIEKLFEFLAFDYYAASNQKLNIPTTGRVVIVANHPLGALDSLALIKLISEVRRDIKIVANHVLMSFDNLEDILLPVDNMSNKTRKSSVKEIYNALENEEAVIMFPAGEVSRAGLFGIKDGEWNSGFYRFAKKTDSPILPIYINAKNSLLFYMRSALLKPLSALLLVQEVFKKRSKSIQFTVGEMINLRTAKLDNITLKSRVRLIRKHLHRIGRGKEGIILTESCIAHPEERQYLKSEFKKAQLLGETRDNKKIYLASYAENSVLMREIGRLREVSFRRVGEGSGKKRDLDKYDHYYKHIILWDDEKLELVGAYRIGESDYMMHKSEFYSHSLFNFEEKFESYMENSIELGRSFVQPAYWGSRALDYLWQGIGAYLKKHPNVRYMFGTVSISNSIPNSAKEQIVALYLKHFGEKERLVTSNLPYSVDIEEQLPNARASYEEDFLSVKENLAFMDTSIPILYKQYSDLCEDDGVKFLDFNIDPEFEYCVDGFILVDIHKMKAKKRARYIG